MRLVKIKLFGGLICNNRNLPYIGQDRFSLEVQEGSTLEEVHRLLNLNPPRNLVSIVNGHAQSYDHRINEDCTISIFPPMADRQYNLFEKI